MSQTEKKPKNVKKRAPRQSIGDEDFGQSALLDDELRGSALNARTITAASMEMARARPQQRRSKIEQRLRGNNVCVITQRESFLGTTHSSQIHKTRSNYWQCRKTRSQQTAGHLLLFDLRLIVHGCKRLLVFPSRSVCNNFPSPCPVVTYFFPTVFLSQSQS